MKSLCFQYFDVHFVSKTCHICARKKIVVQCDCSRVILHYTSCKFLEMVAMCIKHTVLDKNHTELEVQCSGCVPTYHSKLLIFSSDIFLFIDFMILVHIYGTNRKTHVNLP